MLETIFNDIGTIDQLGDFRRQNLTILRDALLANELPFEMETYCRFESKVAVGQNITLDLLDDLRKAQGKEDCGTAACAVGWAPLFIPPGEDILEDSNVHGAKVFNYNTYSEAYLLPTDNDWWDWCFSGNWSSVDNTRLGAAYRISVLLEADETDLRAGPPLGNECISEEEADDVSYFEDRAKWLAKRGIKE